MVPCSVPKEMVAVYKRHWDLVTKQTGRLFLFAGDQKIEHLNADFYSGETHTPAHVISPDAKHPEHLFKIAAAARIGVFATQLGLVARHGADHAAVPYLIKMNAKTNLIPLEVDDPLSLPLVTVDQVVRFKQQSGLQVVGIGLTIYLGSKYEAQMLAEASKAIVEAHQHGLLTVLWIYPRGKAVRKERTEAIIAGAAGVAHALGADFVKVNPPLTEQGDLDAALLGQASAAAGNTGVLCSGGPAVDAEAFLHVVHQQMHAGRTAGAAIGRNIHQKNLPEAVAFCDALAAIIYDGAEVAEAVQKLQ